jgi:hypothetical protein
LLVQLFEGSGSFDHLRACYGTDAAMYLVNSDCAVWAEIQYETKIYAHCFNMCGTVDLIWYRQCFNCVLLSF